MRDAYDMVVIGGGPAGQGAAELAAFYGRSVLLVQDGPPGGAVTTTGGVPTKTLREFARHIRDVGPEAMDPEQALRKTNRKFRHRFGYVERELAGQGKALRDSSVMEMEELWQEAKSKA